MISVVDRSVRFCNSIPTWFKPLCLLRKDWMVLPVTPQMQLFWVPGRLCWGSTLSLLLIFYKAQTQLRAGVLISSPLLVGDPCTQHAAMAVKRSSPSLQGRESDSEEELPTFSFLKRQPLRQEKVTVVVTSDSEGSCPPSPESLGLSSGPVSAETGLQSEAVLVSSSDSEEGEELIPLADRLTCKFVTRQQLSPEDSSSNALIHRSHEGASCDWGNQPFWKSLDAPFIGTSERNASSDKDLPRHQPPAHQPTCPPQTSSLMATKATPDIPFPQRTARCSKKMQGQPQPQGPRVSRKESHPRRQEGRKKAVAPVSRPKVLRPEECLKHMLVVLDPGPASTPSSPSPPRAVVSTCGPLTDSPFPIRRRAAADRRRGPGARRAAVHGVPLCD